MIIQVEELLAEYRSTLMAKIKAGSDHATVIDEAWADLVAPKLRQMNAERESIAHMSDGGAVPLRMDGPTDRYARTIGRADDYPR